MTVAFADQASAQDATLRDLWTFRLADIAADDRQSYRSPQFRSSNRSQFVLRPVSAQLSASGTSGPHLSDPCDEDYVGPEPCDDDLDDSGEAEAASGEVDEERALLPLQVTVGARRFQPVLAELTQTRILKINPVQLARTLSDIIDETAAQEIASLGDRLVAVEEVEALGIRLTLNPGSFEIEAVIDNSRLRRRSFQASEDVSFRGAVPVAPSEFAFGLTAATEISSLLEAGFDPAVRIDADGFANFGGIDGINFEYGGRFNVAGRPGANFFDRDRLILFKDWPDRALRLSAGDIVPVQARLAGSFDLLGISFSRNYESIQPTRNIRPTANRGLFLEQRSIVEVYVNGIQVERFVADPGPIDINRIAVNSFGNDVSIVVEDSFGRREVDSFRFTSDIDLLAEGIDQFSFSIGALRNPDFFGFSYSDEIVASAFYERGVSNTLTVFGHAVASTEQVNAGVGGAVAIPFGLVSVEAAGSSSQRDGSGFSLAAQFRGAPLFGASANEFLTVSFEYRSRDFSQFDSFIDFGSVKYDAGIDYQVDIRPNLSLFANTGILERYGIDGTDRFASAGIRTSLGPVQLTVSGRYIDRAGFAEEFGVLAGVSVPLGRRNTATASYDSISGEIRADYRRRRGLELPEIDYRLGIVHGDDDTEILGDFGFSNTRFESRARVQRLFRHEGGDDTSIVSARFQTGLAYADGVLAIGRDPGRGFAIVSRHPSINDSNIRVLSSAGGRELAMANDLGPAVVSLLTPYRPQSISLSAENLPIGYDLGQSEYLLSNGARSGFAIELGSEDFRSAIATLVFDGQPVALAYGTFVRIDGGNETQGTFFTNRQGRAAFSNLAPGRYEIEIGELRLRGQFVIDESAEALVRLGVLELELP